MCPVEPRAPRPRRRALFGAEAGALGQTLFAAPGLIPGAGSASDCSPDLAITLTHTRDDGDPGGPATFVATVTNVGPFISTSGLVSVDDHARPRASAHRSASRRRLDLRSARRADVTCTQRRAGCRERASRRSPSTRPCSATGPAALEQQHGDGSERRRHNAANNTATDIVGVRAPTLARVRAVRRPFAGPGRAPTCAGARATRSDNLGFRVYREVDGLRTRVTPSLVAGSALIAGSRCPSRGPPLRVGRRVTGRPGVVYWLEDIDLDGTRTWTGPVTPERPDNRGFDAAAAPGFRSPTLASLVRTRDRRSGSPGPGIGHEQARRRLGPASLEQRRLAASRSAARLLVPREGFYRVTRTSCEPPASIRAATRARCGSSPTGASSRYGSTTAGTACCKARTLSSSTASASTAPSTATAPTGW